MLIDWRQQPSLTDLIAELGGMLRTFRADSKTEQRFLADHILPRISKGEVLNWWFEPFTLTLPGRRKYTPDFWLLRSDGIVEVWEVKGSWSSPEARYRFDVAADIYPQLRFSMARWDGTWQTRQAFERYSATRKSKRCKCKPQISVSGGTFVARCQHREEKGVDIDGVLALWGQ